jgi:hypothetical protein
MNGRAGGRALVAGAAVFTLSAIWEGPTRVGSAEKCDPSPKTDASFCVTYGAALPSPLYAAAPADVAFSLANTSAQHLTDESDRVHSVTLAPLSARTAVAPATITGCTDARLTADLLSSPASISIHGTATSFTLAKTASKIKVAGSVRPGRGGEHVDVTLLRKSGGTFHVLASHTVTLTAGSDFTTAFAPARKRHLPDQAPLPRRPRLPRQPARPDLRLLNRIQHPERTTHATLPHTGAPGGSRPRPRQFAPAPACQPHGSARASIALDAVEGRRADAVMVTDLTLLTAMLDGIARLAPRAAIARPVADGRQYGQRSRTRPSFTSRKQLSMRVFQ